MKKADPSIRPASGQRLRQQAEEKLSKRQESPAKELDTLRLIHELEVQNEQLIQAHAETEAALRQYADLYDFAPVGYFTLTRDGAISMINLTGANLLGEARNKLVKRRFGVFVSVKSRPAFNAFLEKIFSSAGNQACEIMLLKDGQESCWVRLDGVCSEDGLECRVVMKDIAERKQAEDALRKSEERYHGLFNSMEEGLAINEIVEDENRDVVDYIILSVNPAFEKQTIYKIEEAIGKRATDLYQMTPEYITGWWKNHSQFHGVAHTEMYHEPSKRWFHITTTPPDGKRFATIFTDITERKQAEEALLASQHLLAEAQRIGKLGHAEWAAGRNELVCSDEMLRIFELPPDGRNISMSTLSARVNPEDRKYLAEMDRKIFAEHSDLDYEYRIILSGGRVGWIHQQAKISYNENGQPIRMIGVFQDITLRKQAEEALRESEDKFKYFFEHSTVGKSLTLPTGEINANQALCDMLGYTLPEFKSKKWQEITHPEDIELTQREVEQLLSGKRDSARFVKRFIHKDGSVVWVDLSTSLRRDADGKPLYLMTSVIDISARVRAEEVLKQEQALSNAIIEAIPGTFYMLDEIGQYVRWNAYQRDEIVGKPDDLVRSTNALDTIHPDDRALIQSKIVNVLANDVDETIEGRVLLRGGPAFRWLLMTGCRMLIDNRPFLVGIGIDISERKQAGDLLRESEERFKAIANFGVSWESWFGPDGKYIWVNPGVEHYTGYSAQEILAMSDFISTVIADEDRSMFIQYFQEAIHGNRGENFEFRYLHKNGARRWLSASWQPIYDAQGNPLGTRSSGYDITARKQAEDVLQQKVDELERWQSLTVGRELKMIELKKEINTLREQAGQPQEYKIVEGT